LVQGDPAAGGLLHDDEVARWKFKVPGLRHVQLHGVGHGLSLESPMAFLDAIQPFLREVCRAGGVSRPRRVGPGDS
jgi:hypothetical protein